MAGSGVFRRLPATSTRFAGLPAYGRTNRTGSGRRARGKPREKKSRRGGGDAAPERARDGGETAPETVLLDVPAGKLPQRGLDLDPHALPQPPAPAGGKKKGDARAGAPTGH